MTRKQCSMEFKDEALALAERFGVPASARGLGLQESQLYSRRVKARAESTVDRIILGKVARSRVLELDQFNIASEMAEIYRRL